MTRQFPRAGGPRPRAWWAVPLAVVLLTSACGGSDDAPTSRASGSPRATASTGAATSSAAVPTDPATEASPSPTASIAQPPDPVVESGNQGAWTLTRAAPGASASQQVKALECQPGGIVAATGLYLYPGGSTLTLTGGSADQTVTVPGTSTVDAAGGTFRGRNGDTAVVFTWIC